MGRTLGAGSSVGHPFLCETTILCAQSLWQTHRSGRELGRVALPTVQRHHELSREGFPQYSLCPYGGLHWMSLMNSTRQGNGSSSWTVRPGPAPFLPGERGRARNNSQTKERKKSNCRLGAAETLISLPADRNTLATYSFISAILLVLFSMISKLG